MTVETARQWFTRTIATGDHFTAQNRAWAWLRAYAPDIHDQHAPGLALVSLMVTVDEHLELEVAAGRAEHWGITETGEVVYRTDRARTRTAGAPMTRPVVPVSADDLAAVLVAATTTRQRRDRR